MLDEIVVVAAKSEQQLRDVSSNVAFLSQEQLQSISHTHINEAMHRIAGAWISRGNGQEHLTAIRSPVLTGAGSCGAFLMAQDGVSLRAAGFCNVNELFESASELAGRIEVIRGPGSAIHGSNALHGVVNVITPAPAPGKRASVEAGPWDYYRSKLHLSSDSLRLDMSGTSDGGWKDESGFDQQKLLVKQVARQADASLTTTLAYTNLNQETAGFVQGDDAYKVASLRRSNPNPEAWRDARSLRLVSTWVRDWQSGSLQIRPYLRSVDMQFLQHFLPGQPIEENGHDSIGVQSLWISNSDQPDQESSEWRVGLEFEITDGFLKETQLSPTISGIARLVATLPEGKHYDYEVDASMIALFAENRHLLGDKLVLTAGLRYEHMRYDYNNLMLDGNTRDNGMPCTFNGVDGCRHYRPADRKDSFSNLSPKLGLVYSLDDRRQVYSQLARGFRAPQATELYRLQGGQSVSNIDSERLHSLELGYRGSSDSSEMAPSAAWDISLFVMRKSNFIFRDSNRRNVDRGKTAHNGIEASIVWQLHDNWRLNGAFTWARHTYDNNPPNLANGNIKNNDIDTAPETLGSLAVTWVPPVLTGSLNLELEWVHVGSHYTDPLNSNKYEGHNLLHLRGNWSPSGKYSTFFRIMNLTDQDYAERADFAFGNERYFVGTPLAVYLGASLNF